MAANVLTYNAIGTILNQIVTQATGKAQITPTNTSEFTAVAQTGLLTGYDNLMGAISQVLSRTVISTRPYSRKFKGLEADNIRYGNHVRKINYIDRDWEDGSRLPLTTGVTVDDQAPTLDEVLQTNFYGQNDYEIPWTLFSNQIDVAFQNADELGAFISGKLQNISDMTEQKHESMARMVIANLIAGTINIANGNQVVHLVTEYNTYSGYSPVKTLTDIRGDALEYAKFTKWVYGRVAQVSAMLTERSIIFHQNVTNKEISRHSDYGKQNVYLLSSERFQMEAGVLADVYHDNYLRMADTDILNFWQSITSPDTISVTPTYMKADGTLDAATAVSQSNVFGVITDVEAAGYTIVNQRTTSAAYNGKGEFQNFWLKFTDRYWNDFTENTVVLLMD